MAKRLLLSLTLLTSILTASAYDFMDSDGICYMLYSDGKSVKVTYQNLSTASSWPSYSNLSGPLTISESVTYNGISYTVISIDSYAFRGCSGLTSVTIPNSVTSIGNYAFEDCSGLTSVSIPISVSSIGERAFSGCIGLKSVHISDLAAWCRISFPTYSTNPLGYAHNLYLNGEKVTDLVIPNSVTSIGGYAFDGCSGLTSVIIPNSVTSVGWFAFQNCSSMTSVSIGNSVSYIGSGTFSGCTDMAIVTIGESVSSIEESAFSGCSSLSTVKWNAKSCADFYSNSSKKYYAPFSSGISSVEFGDQVERIPAYLCYGLSGLTSVTIPNSVSSIGNRAFYGCNGLTSVKIPNSVTSIGSEVFSNCTGLTSVTIGSSVTAIGGNPFYNCNNLTNFKWNVRNYSSSCQAFQSCNSITNIEIGDEVERIPPYLCSGLSNLRQVTIGSAVTAIGSYAFNGCVRLTNITLPNSVTSIGGYAFQNCSGLTSVTSLISQPADVILGSSIFSGVSKNCRLWVPTTTTDNYKSLSQWKDFEKIYAPVESISFINPNVSIYIGDAASLDISLSPYDTDKTSLLWKSDNNNVATVDQNGRMTAKNLGAASITASATDGFGATAVCDVTVTGITKIKLNKVKTSIYKNGTEQLQATITPQDVIINTLSWSSSNTGVATVDQNGKVTAQDFGTTTITAAATDGSGVTATCEVTVKGITNITLNKSTTSIYKGDTEQLQASITPSDVIINTLSWSSSNISVATVDQAGTVIAKGLGTATITAKATDGSEVKAKCEVSVLSPYILSAPDIGHVRGMDVTYDLPVSFFSRESISGLQFTIKIPNEWALVTDDFGIYDVWLDNNRKTRSHSVQVEENGNSSTHNYYKVIISSTTNANLRGQDGVLLHVNLKAATNYHSQTGDYQIKYSSLVAAEADETQHFGDDSQSTARLIYIVGDANADVNVDIADYVCTANYILGRSNATDFFIDAANANYSDNTINVTDLVAIINYALELKDKEYRPSRLSSVEVTPDGVDYAMEAKVVSATAKNAVVSLTLDNDRPLAALQLDIDLPSGVKLAAATATERAKGLDASVGTSPDGKTRIILAGFGDGAIEAGFGDVLTLTLQGDIRTGDMMTVDDVTMAERDLTEHGIAAPLFIDISHASGIGGASYDHVEIYVEHGSIVIESPIAGYAQLARLNGVTQTVEVKPGKNVYEVTTSIGDVIIASFNGVIKKFQF